MLSKAKRNASAAAELSPMQPSHNDIRSRAHEIYVERGEYPGRELDDWLQAERELLGFAAESNAASK